MRCAMGLDNYKYMCYICAKGFLDSKFNQAVIDKISVFPKLPQILHIFKNRNFESIIGKRKTNCF